MLIRMAEPALGRRLDWGGEPPGSDSAFGAVELVVLGAAASEPAALGSVFGIAGLELAGPPVASVWAGAPAGPVLSEPVCALAGKANIAAKNRTMTKLRKCLRESKDMSCPSLRRDEPLNIVQPIWSLLVPSLGNKTSAHAVKGP